MKPPKVDWEEAKRLENEDFVVRVNRLPLRFPRFSVSISGKTGDGRDSRFVPVRWEGQGQITVLPIVGKLIPLIEQAQAFIQVELQVAEDRKIDDMQDRETHRDQQAERFGPQKRPGLKELSKRDALVKKLYGH